MASKVLCFVIVLFVCLNSKFSQAFDSDLSKEEDLELEKQLKLLNKPPIKTFQTKEGDIIDCVDINKQPALDHPLLKDHKIQTRPSIYLSNWLRNSSRSNYDPLKSNNNREPCPVGFVPIRRTLKKDLIRLRRSPSSSNKRPNDGGDDDDYFMDNVMFPYERNVVSLSMMEGPKYYGALAYLAVYDLSVGVGQDQSSSSNIWIVGGPTNALNVILAGWQVNPSINGDSRTRLFVYWTNDGGATTGCYNMLCQGFIQLDRSITPDFPISPTSIYQGQQYDYVVSIIQDRQTGHWWLRLKEDQIAIGYWPKELFSHLSDGANKVAWGGIAKPSYGISPPLGNSHMPNGEYNEACYFRSIRYIVDGYKSESPNAANMLSYVSNSNCYNLNNNQNCGHDELYYCFTFGGPGGSNCGSDNN